jgi:hypothetical protein
VKNQSQLETLRAQLGETDAPSTEIPALHKQQDLGAHGARGPPQLDRYYRFRDLRDLGIVPNWVTLADWIRNRGFPPGKLVSPRIRIWSRSSVQDWLDSQSSEAA